MRLVLVNHYNYQYIIPTVTKYINHSCMHLTMHSDNTPTKFSRRLVCDD